MDKPCRRKPHYKTEPNLNLNLTHWLSDMSILDVTLYETALTNATSLSNIIA
jgi:hypothetical protein